MSSLSLDQGFSLFIDGKYQSTAWVFRIIQDGGKLRLLIKFRIFKEREGLNFGFNGRDLILVYKEHGPRDEYNLNEVMLYVHGLKERRRWITFRPDELICGYIEYWSDDWKYNL